MTVTIYGISNCDTMKKARTFLAENGVDHVFHDYRKAGLDTDLLARFVQELGWEALVNRRGTTWRKLPEETRAGVTDAASAIAVLVANPSLIKRPVLDADGCWLVGFNREEWTAVCA